MWHSVSSVSDLDRTFAHFDALRRQMLRAFDEPAFERGVVERSPTPRFSMKDTGTAWELKAELPGVPPEAVELTLTGQVLRLRAERKATTTPEGYTPHRQERPAFVLNRSITVPQKVDAERVTATAKDGVFTVTLPKAAEAVPRTIAIKTA